MPVIRVETNVPTAEISPDFREKVTGCLCATLNKPKERITFVLEGGKAITKGGSTDPFYIVKIAALDVFDGLTLEKKREYVKAFLDFFNNELHIPNKCVLMLFEPLQRTLIG